MAADLALNSSDFQKQVLESEVPVLIDWWAPWCGPCRAIAPAVEEVASQYQGKAKVYKIDVDDNQELSSEYGVMNIPALHVFKGGKVVNKGVGMMSKAQIAQLIDSAL